MALAVKDPDATVDYRFDWGSDYVEDQLVLASSWRVEPAEAGGLAIEAESKGLLLTSVRVSGGLAGQVYHLTNRVTLSDGQCDERSIAVRVEAR